MNPVRRKMLSFLTEVARKAIGALEPQSPCAEELSKIEVDDIIRPDIEKLCRAATLAEITKVIILVARLKKTSGQEKGAIKSDLKRIAEELVTRVEKQSPPLRLSKTCWYLLLDF